MARSIVSVIAHKYRENGTAPNYDVGATEEGISVVTQLLHQCQQQAGKVAHFCSMCGPSFCSMKISQDVRDFAAKEGVDEQAALAKGMEQKAVEFVKRGSQLYSKA